MPMHRLANAEAERARPLRLVGGLRRQRFANGGAG